jgi:putative FmdB family regulatory protein
MQQGEVTVPIYEYRCSACGSEFELLVSGSAGPPACPECHTGEVKRRFSLFAVAGASRQAVGSSSCGGCTGKNCSTCH